MTLTVPFITPACILEVIEDMTAPAAYWMMDSLGYRNDNVGYGESCFAVKTLIKMDQISYLPAKQVRLCFWGGPPNKLKWYHGTLQDLLVDRILDYYMENSLEALMDKLCLNVH